MKVFISWSGDRSRAVAKALSEWLPKVLQGVEPFFSPDDIGKGSLWRKVLAAEMEETNVGIVCLTPENLEEPWILFEAGALGKFGDSRVCTYLFDLDNTDVSQPLAAYNHTKCAKEDTRALVETLDGERDQKDRLQPQQLKETFDMWWPKLKQQLDAVEPAKNKHEKRSIEDMVEELLSLAREQQWRSHTGTPRLAELLAQTGPQPTTPLHQAFATVQERAQRLGLPASRLLEAMEAAGRLPVAESALADYLDGFRRAQARRSQGDDGPAAPDSE